MRGPRRTSTGRPGVYRRTDANGRERFEVWYHDAERRRRWQAVTAAVLVRHGLAPSGRGGRVLLADAVALREALHVSVRSGEYVPPSRSTLREVADEWLAGQSGLREKTRRGYRWAFDVHVFPKLGASRVQDIGPDEVAGLLAGMKRDGYSAHTVRAVLTPLSRLLAHCARRRMIHANPCAALDRSERPKLDRRRVRVLSREEMAALLAAAGTIETSSSPSSDTSSRAGGAKPGSVSTSSCASSPYRAALATAMFSGLRVGELLALRWQDVDFAAGVLCVRWQVSGKGELVEPKTPQAKRDVVLMPSLARVLREHRAASRFSRDEHFVFASATGRPLDPRNLAQRGLREAAEAAGLLPKRKPKKMKRRAVGSVPAAGEEQPLTMHVLRHCFTSLLIAQGEDVTFVSRQLGHANPAITLRVYAHLWDARRHADDARERLEAGYGAVLDGRIETSRSPRGPDSVLEQ